MSDDKKADKPASAPDRRPAGAKEYDRIAGFLVEIQGEVFPLTTERLRVLIGDDAYVAVVNYERAEKGQEALAPGDALDSRAKLFDRKTFDRSGE